MNNPQPLGSWLGPRDKMPEAEVALRLAEHLSEVSDFDGHVDVAIDGASVAVGGTVIFDIENYLLAYRWIAAEAAQKGKNAWATIYKRGTATMRVHSRSGQGDVVASIAGRRVIAECKKGPLIKKPGSPEYPLLTTAIGQALLLPSQPEDLVVAAVPDTPTFRRLALDWGTRPKMLQANIRIALVGRDGTVSLDLS